jgi:hypothetical protein
MKKAKKSTRKVSRSGKSRSAKPRRAKSRATRARGGSARPKPVARKAQRAKAGRSAASGTRLHAGSAATFAAGVLSRRAAKVQTLAKAAATEVPRLKPVTKSVPPAAAKQGKGHAARAGKLHGAAALPGNRPLVRVTRHPTFNYMRAPGLKSGYDVGDTVEVFCDHEKDGERVRGWVKGVVVQVDNKLVAVQFRSNVFLTDGWMVPDRILWYSLGSDQIRGTGAAKKVAREPFIPEY